MPSHTLEDLVQGHTGCWAGSLWPVIRSTRACSSRAHPPSHLFHFSSHFPPLSPFYSAQRFLRIPTLNKMKSRLPHSSGQPKCRTAYLETPSALRTSPSWPPGSPSGLHPTPMCPVFVLPPSLILPGPRFTHP